ncbi:MAG: hypothetical protein U1A78_41675 [Polyangia bacterium]
MSYKIRKEPGGPAWQVVQSPVPGSFPGSVDVKMDNVPDAQRAKEIAGLLTVLKNGYCDLEAIEDITPR